MTPEGRIKAKVKRALEGYYRFMPVQNGMGAPSLDFLYCIHGMFVAVETKVPGKKITDRQKLTAQQICESGGQVFVIRDEADIAFMLKSINDPVQIKGLFYDPKQ